MLVNGIEKLIGGTPLVRLEKLEKKYSLEGHIFAKVEFFNPGGSIKDRAALFMLDDAESRGLVRPGATIIEPTSGNTGLGLAMIGSERGYRVILVMPETMSVERRKAAAAYGAEVVLTEGSLGMKGAIAKAEQLNREIPGSFIPSQFTNNANARAHYMTTGPEIEKDLGCNADYLVAGVGTGGTVTGTGRYLKEKMPGIKIVAVEPDTSSVLSGGKPGPHKLQGIGAGFVPCVLDTDIIDVVKCISGEDAYKAVRTLVSCEGFLCGISSGAALRAAMEIAAMHENKGKNIVVIFPDTGERYLSVDNLF